MTNLRREPMTSPRRLKVSSNRRFLVYDDVDETPFFYLADTAWELFHRLTRAEADLYLEDRAAKGFTVIQAVVLAELDGLNAPNANGDRPLHDNDPTKPNEAYFAHVDTIVNKAKSLGLVVGMLPTWGDKYNSKWAVNQEIFTPENARVYAEFLGARYKENAIIWILGGDRPQDNETHLNVNRALAAGLRAQHGGAQLTTFHPCGQQKSSQYFHGEEWLDFNMCQTGHTFDRDNYRTIAEDYALDNPLKPCLDAEPGYEDHPSGWKPETGYLNSWECRKFFYWATFAGACGHTYGNHNIWQMLDAGRAPISAARHTWRESLDMPGSLQMRIGKDLLLSRVPYLSRVPARGLLVSDALDGGEHIEATRESDGAYALIYSASGQPFTLNMALLSSGANYRGQWLNPRTGETTDCGTFASETGETPFTPPTNGRMNDWVLTLDRM